MPEPLQRPFLRLPPEDDVLVTRRDVPAGAEVPRARPVELRPRAIGVVGAR